MGEHRGLSRVTIYWGDQTVAVEHGSNLNRMPAADRNIWAPWSSVTGAEIVDGVPCRVRLKVAGASPATLGSDPWAIPVRDRDVAENLVEVVEALAAGERPSTEAMAAVEATTPWTKFRPWVGQTIALTLCAVFVAAVLILGVNNVSWLG